MSTDRTPTIATPEQLREALARMRVSEARAAVLRAFTAFLEASAELGERVKALGPTADGPEDEALVMAMRIRLAKAEASMPAIRAAFDPLPLSMLEDVSSPETQG